MALLCCAECKRVRSAVALARLTHTPHNTHSPLCKHLTLSMLAAGWLTGWQTHDGRGKCKTRTRKTSPTRSIAARKARDTGRTQSRRRRRTERTHRNEWSVRTLLLLLLLMLLMLLLRCWWRLMRLCGGCRRWVTVLRVSVCMRVC